MEKDFIPLNLRTIRKSPKIEVKSGQLSENNWTIFFFTFVGLFVFFMMISGVYVDKYRQIQVKQVEILAIEEELASLREENQLIEKNIIALKTETGQEKIARKKLKLILPDEYIVEWEND